MPHRLRLIRAPRRPVRVPSPQRPGAGTMALAGALAGALALLLGVVAACSAAEVNWVGRTQAELLEQRGEPASVRVRPTGELLLEYIDAPDTLDTKGPEAGSMGPPPRPVCRDVYLVTPAGHVAAQKRECH